MIKKDVDIRLRLSAYTRQWCATVRDNRQVLSFAGVGGDPIEALVNLYLNVKNAAVGADQEEFMLDQKCCDCADSFLFDYHRGLVNIVAGIKNVEQAICPEFDQAAVKI